MTIWFTADLHLGHQNIIRYCDRPFDDVDAMNRALVDRWNEVVDDGDDVWVLGDFALGRIADTLALAGELRGRKVLLAGNHDRCWAGHDRRVEEWTQRYLEAGFDEIVQGTTTMDIADRTVRLCHFPYRGDSHGQDRYLDHRPVDHGEWLLHGHVHERWARQGRMINVGVDVHRFRPVHTDEIAAIIHADPTNPDTGLPRT
jgi:calcineurin-like phosphoesterase family protein